MDNRKKITIHLIPTVRALITSVLVTSFFVLPVAPVGSASDTDTVQVSVTVESTISLTSPSDLTLQVGAGNIVGYGDTGGDESVTWAVTTNNAAGYTISWLAEETGVNTDGAMENAAGDLIAAYSPGTADTPEAWSVAASASEWGAHLGISGLECTASGITSTWGTNDTTGANWLNVHHSASQEICSNATETDVDGHNIPVYFRAEVGANALQSTGAYTVNVTLTATTQ